MREEPIYPAFCRCNNFAANKLIFVVKKDNDKRYSLGDAAICLVVV